MRQLIIEGSLWGAREAKIGQDTCNCVRQKEKRNKKKKTHSSAKHASTVGGSQEKKDAVWLP